MDTTREGCAGCAHGTRTTDDGSKATRRDFIRGAAGTLAALFAAAGMAPGELAALPFGSAKGRSDRDGSVTYPLPTADGVTIDRDNEIILVRWSARIYAFALSCPHQRTMLKWREKDAVFQCTKHKSKYQPDGTFISGRATRGMDRYPVRVAGGSVTVDTSSAILQDEDESAWLAAAASLS
jgi:nitrite reductase/ring-hydroxylating ferredoxin subunit